MKKLTREWIRKAEADHRTASALSGHVPPLNDGVSFHCQQCVEKYLKALLEELGLGVPKTHDLDHLLTLLKSHYPQLRSLRRGLLFLSDYAVEIRYPSNWTTRRQAQAAQRWADRVRTMVRSLLGIWPRPPRGTKSP